MVDYSKWKNIEVSDDEDDTHPNIDTPSLFRWRHQARVERMEEHRQEKEKLESTINTVETKRKELKEKLKATPDQKEKLEKELKNIEDEAKKLEIAEQEFKKKEKLQPWNVDTLSQPKFSKTIINKKEEKTYDEMTDEEKEAHMKKFVKENEKLIKEFGMLRRFEDSKKFLLEHSLLVHEDTANYLVIWCINLQMEDKHELMTHVAHQCICMQYMLELSRQLKTDPRACIGPFFDRIQVADIEYRKQFDDEIAAFIGRIERRSKEKIAEALKEQEAEEEKERLERLGPGGLDPADVFESLPKELQDCFEKRDTELLKQVIASLPEDQARYHMKRCVDSGLWVADANANEHGLVEEKVPVESESSAKETTQANNDLDLD
ncbi:CLUMA_CG010333, isoform A [Clunio marinus]|uniref:Hsp90 co-chaperone Cdc37 n=1 Tax=Clunio marinus TaxID=568069 RepID=A0A1J1IDA4_9DIPT|nr:CLUMA_CG010333, isoform A [Clunio marinus]